MAWHERPREALTSDTHLPMRPHLPGLRSSAGAALLGLAATGCVTAAEVLASLIVGS